MIKQPTPIDVRDMAAKHSQLVPCPAVLVRLMSLLNSDTSAGQDISQIISMDPVLTLQVVRVANSPAFGVSRKISSLDTAIIRLGYRSVWEIAVAINTKNLFAFRETPWVGLPPAVWEHSLRMATLGRVLCRIVNPRASDLFFTAALLHDFGKLLLHRHAIAYSQFMKDGQRHGDESIESEGATFGVDHADLAGHLLRHWNFPEVVVKLVATHHVEPAETDALVNIKRLFRCADFLSYAWTDLFNNPEEDNFLSTTSDRRVVQSSVTPEIWKEVAVVFHQEFDKVHESLSMV